MTRTAQSVFDETRAILAPVPHVSNDFVCQFCLGPVSGWPQCYDCNQLFLKSTCPRDLRESVIPMTIAMNRGPWYSCLWTYKRAEFTENAPKVASLVYVWLMEHRTRIEGILGGPWDMITVVPSKRDRPATERQPLREALRLIHPINVSCRDVLRFVNGSTYGRNTFTPDIFERSVDDVRGQRILLIEDTWITGATAVSAAGALLGLGAKSVVITPIAREVRLAFWERDAPHEFCEAVRTVPYDLAAWPR